MAYSTRASNVWKEETTKLHRAMLADHTNSPRPRATEEALGNADKKPRKLKKVRRTSQLVDFQMEICDMDQAPKRQKKITTKKAKVSKESDEKENSATKPNRSKKTKKTRAHSEELGSSFGSLESSSHSLEVGHKILKAKRKKKPVKASDTESSPTECGDSAIEKPKKKRGKKLKQKKKVNSTTTTSATTESEEENVLLANTEIINSFKGNNRRSSNTYYDSTSKLLHIATIKNGLPVLETIDLTQQSESGEEAFGVFNNLEENSSDVAANEEPAIRDLDEILSRPTAARANLTMETPPDFLNSTFTKELDSTYTKIETVSSRRSSRKRWSEVEKLPILNSTPMKINKSRKSVAFDVAHSPNETVNVTASKQSLIHQNVLILSAKKSIKKQENQQLGDIQNRRKELKSATPRRSFVNLSSARKSTNNESIRESFLIQNTQPVRKAMKKTDSDSFRSGVLQVNPTEQEELATSIPHLVGDLSSGSAIKAAATTTVSSSNHVTRKKSVKISTPIHTPGRRFVEKVKGTPLPLTNNKNFIAGNSLDALPNNDDIPSSSSTPYPSQADVKAKTQSKVKVPNFRKIHEKQADKMENIVEMQERKAVRARLLLSGKRPPPLSGHPEPSGNEPKKKLFQGKSPQAGPSKLPTLNGLTRGVLKHRRSSSEGCRRLSAEKKRVSPPNKKKQQQQVVENNEKAAPQKAVTRFGFKFGNGAKITKEQQIKAVLTKGKVRENITETNRKVVSNYRTNRRFELLMKLRENQKK